MEAKRIGVRQLKNEATRIVRSVREERAEYVVTVHGDPVARIQPYTADREANGDRQAELDRWFREMDLLAEEIGKAWKSPLTAAEAVAEQRRTL